MSAISSNLRVSSPIFQTIFNEALKEYKKKTGKELTTHPLAGEIKSCDSPEAILAVLQGKANGLNQSQSSDERLTKWLTPTVNVLNALAATLGEGVGTVFPPTKIIFSGISILLVAARDTAASRDALIELFDRMENFFVRLQTYTRVPPTAEMMKVMGEVMAEVLSMLAIATKEMKQGRTKTFFKKLVGRTDVEDALQKLDKLEQGELRTVTAQVLEATSDIKDGVKRIEVIAQQIGTDIGGRDWERLLKDLRQWLTPPDPSTNHNIACSAQHERTAAWVFNEDVFKEWESTGSLLWIHGKPGSGKSVLCSTIIQHIVAQRDAGLASLAYFYFDFRHTQKQHRRDLLRSLLIQLSAYSSPCCDIMYRLYSTHGKGTQQPRDEVLKNCLKEMLSAVTEHPVYIILDALDECPNTSGVMSPRDQVLALVKDLVDLCLSNLRVCITSRPEVDIRTALEPLPSLRISLQDQAGQKEDIATYVTSVVQSDSKMKSWREDDRKLVIETLCEKADGMFRWVFCQLEVLRHCLAPSLRRQLNELPKSLDETYERVLKEIESTKQGNHARRLLHCLAVALRPLRVEELADVLAFDLDVAEGEIPRFHAEWRWEDQEQAVLSACSSLISIVDSYDSRVVQFSHFSVKEYLTSDRLFTASGDNVSRYHIVSEPAHLMLARACLGALLNLDNRAFKECNENSNKSSDVGGGKHGEKEVPLLKYAARHWASHAHVDNVTSRLNDVMETLFDLNKPYFLAWIRIHDIDPNIPKGFRDKPKPKPLYYAALCGFYNLVQRLIAKHPEQVNNQGGRYNSPLVAALSGKHIQVAELLLKHGARVNVRGEPPLFYAIASSDDARVEAVQFLLRRGADVNAAQKNFWTPLHLAAYMGYLNVTRILLEHRADVDLQNDKGQAPLHLVSTRIFEECEGERFILAQLLVERGADVKAQDKDDATPLHFASYQWQPEIAQLLLDHGADAHAVDVQDRNPLHEVSRGFHVPQLSFAFFSSECCIGGYHHPQIALSVAQLLLEQGVDVNASDKDHATPLHLASSHWRLEIARLLLHHGAKANAENVQGQTPLHLASRGEKLSRKNPNVVRLLLELGVDVNARDKDQATPLHFACSYENFEIALMLLDHGAEVDARNAHGQTPLHCISQSLNRGELENDGPRIARLMLERGADINARDKDQATPLHLASNVLKLRTARVLLEHGANVNVKNGRCQTPLHILSRGADGYNMPYEESDFVRLLPKQGADVNARDMDQATPLHLASSHLNCSIAPVLLDNGATVNAVNFRGQNALHLLSQSSCYFEPDEREFAQLLLERNVDVNARDKDQATPLHLASFYGHYDVAEMLLDHGANAEDIQGQTPLHQVLLGSQWNDHQGSIMRSWTQTRYRRPAQRLLERGADVNAQNKDHETPLHLASRLRLHEMARILLEHGADFNVKNSEGKSPLQLASGRKGKAMKRLLLEYSAKQT